MGSLRDLQLAAMKVWHATQELGGAYLAARWHAPKLALERYLSGFMAVSDHGLLSEMTKSIWRQELFCKSCTQLRDIVPLLQAQNITGVNLPNKAKGELPLLIQQARLLRAALPSVDICVHFSINANYQRSVQASFAALTAFCRQLAAIERCSLLLVSGGGPRKQLHTVKALQLATGTDWADLHLPMAVTFNPYFPDAAAQAEEQQRLRDKLMAGGGRIQAVYLQAGTDVQRLRQGLQFLRGCLDEASNLNRHQDSLQGCSTQRQRHIQRQACSALDQQSVHADTEPGLIRPAKRTRGCSCRAQTASCPAVDPEAWGLQRARVGQPGVQVFGSVFVPSKRLLAAMRFRPWRGVFLSDDYLADVEAAERITRQVLRVYDEHGVVPLVESEVTTEAAVQHVHGLLRL